MAIELPAQAQVDAALVRCEIGVNAVELHGLIAGFIAAGGNLDGDDWLACLELEADPARVRQEAVLQRLRRASIAAFEDPELGFDLLLPDEAASLPERVQALLEWCRGFLSGFCLVPGRVALSEDAQEAFADLTRIAAFAVDEDDQNEEDLQEIAEFARVAVLLIHADRACPPEGANGRLH